MIKTVRVMIEKEYEISLSPELLTQEFVTEFESYMFDLEGDTLEDKQNKLFEFAARQLAQGEEQFIEGLGPVASVRTIRFKQDGGKKINVVWDDTVDDMEAEVVE